MTNSYNDFYSDYTDYIKYLRRLEFTIPANKKVTITFYSNYSMMLVITGLGSMNPNFIAVVTGSGNSSGGNNLSGRYIMRQSNVFLSFTTSDKTITVVNSSSATGYFRLVDLHNNFLNPSRCNAVLGEVTALSGTETSSSKMADLAIT